MNSELKERAERHGRVLGHKAVELRMKGCPVETWCDFLQLHVAAEVAVLPEEDREAYRAECLAAYDAQVDLECLVLNAVPMGRA